MKLEEKELVLKDLCCRLPYGVVVELDEKFGFNKGTHKLVKELLDLYCVEGIKPYLRSMSSMTDEEWKELKSIGYIVPLYDGCFGVDMRAYCKNNQPNYRRFSEFSTIEDWLNAHHLDYRGLIPMGLALEAPEGMYN